MTEERKTLGAQGEQLVAQKYIDNGYEIISRNFEYKTGEIDIIAKQNNSIVFIEVKTRTNTEISQPTDAINKRKRRNIVKTAEYFCYKQKLDLYGYFYRFDVATVIFDKSTAACVIVPSTP